jgi:putative inorganic carbon (HCO3(-)) transporter
MEFVLFIVLNAVLFVRPADLVPGLGPVPLFEVLILACAVSARAGIVRQFRVRSLVAAPVTVCVLGLLGAVVLSQAARFSPWGVRTSAEAFAKVVLYYLVAVAVLNTPSRLRAFAACLVGYIWVLTVVALLGFHGVVDVPALQGLSQPELDPQTGETITLVRFRAAGIFNDPNDLAVILDVGIILSLYSVARPGGIARRLPWLAPLAVFGYALVLTQSRGGLLALMVGLFVLFQARFGWTRALLLGAGCLPALALLVGGRQADLSPASGTGHERVQLWADGLRMFKQSPLFGIGDGQFVEEFGLVAHNSFVQSFVELGLVGGGLFVGACYCVLLALRRPASADQAVGLEDMRPFLLAAVAAYLAGLCSLSRTHGLPTYLLFALGPVYTGLTDAGWWNPAAALNEKLLLRVGTLSLGVLVAISLFVRVFA